MVATFVKIIIITSMVTVIGATLHAGQWEWCLFPYAYIHVFRSLENTVSTREKDFLFFISTKQTCEMRKRICIIYKIDANKEYVPVIVCSYS